MAYSRGKGNYVVNTLNGMAYGFFCSLIIGTILKQLGTFLNVSELTSWGTIASYLMGPAIGVGIGYVIEAKGLNLIAAIIAGAIGAGTFSNGTIQSGNPIIAYVTVIVAIEVVRLIQGKTPIDILLVPFCSILVAGIVSKYIGPYISQVIVWLGGLINDGVALQPLFMSIVVGVLMGMALTAPISSAAIGVMLGLNGLAAGAALAGCCCQMIGFAMMSIDDNDIGDVIAIAIGTSMLQFKNIIRRPVIWLPPILSSIIVAPISTVLCHIVCTPIGSGMGTAGLVGLIEAASVMGGNQVWIILLIVDVLVPAILTLMFYKAFRKLNYIKKGDLKISDL